MSEQTERKDEELVCLARDGDKQAMDELMLRYAGLVRSCVRGFFLVGGESEDLVQEGMIGLYHAVVDYKKMDKGSSFKTFANLCITRRIIDAVKTSLRKKKVPATEQVVLYGNEYLTQNFDPDAEMIRVDEMRELRQKMSRVLSDFEFKVMSMHVDGMLNDEICEVTGKSLKSIDNAIQRSKKKLLEVLKK